jgi:DNA-binding LacI/PurR family transcriptional regulator
MTERTPDPVVLNHIGPGVERAARDAGYALRVVNTLEGDPGGVAGAVESLLEQGVDGIVVSEPIDEGSVSLSVDVPVLVLGAPAALGGSRTVAAGVGAESLARAATEHLLGLGHLTIHHLAGPQRWFAARDRLEGWRAALSAHGREQPPVIEGDWSAASGYAAGREFAAAGDVTAVFAANDDMAISLIRALREAGLRVPGDVSVVGFDDIPVAAYVTPPLTTVRQPFDAVAHEGLRILVQAIEKPDAEPAPANDPPVELVVRASTAPPPTRKAPARGRRTASRSRGAAHAPPAGDGPPTTD